jgi:hypothetical protein
LYKILHQLVQVFSRTRSGGSRTVPFAADKTMQVNDSVEVKGLEPSAYGLQSRRSSS